MKKPLILVVDDDKDVLALLKELLSDDFEVETFIDSDEFLKSLEDLIPSLIILDWMMPVRSGLEILKEIKKKSLAEDVPVAIFTGREASEENMKEAIDAGASAFLQKVSSTYYNLFQIKSLVKLYKNQSQYKEMISLIVHSMQHNINGWLTGIVTIGSMLPMFPEWGEGVFFDKIDQMVESSDQLTKLNMDLNTLLMSPPLKDLETFKAEEALSIAIQEISYLKQDIVTNVLDSSLMCHANKDDFSRMLHYIGLYFSKTLGNTVSLYFDIYKENEMICFNAYVKGVNLKISELFTEAYISDAQQGTILLAATYVRKTVSRYGAKIETYSTENSSGIIIKTLSA